MAWSMGTAASVQDRGSEAWTKAADPEGAGGALTHSIEVFRE